MKPLLLFFLLVSLGSCTGSSLKKKLNAADDLTIYFYTGEATDSIYKIVHTSDKTAIEKLAGFIDGRNAEKQCGAFNGKILFGQGGKDIDSVQFNTASSNCRVFVYNSDGKQQTVPMSNEAADMLVALREERKFY